MMRDHVVEQALLTLLDYLEDTSNARDKCAVIREFAVSAYIVAMACEELEESISELESGKSKNKERPLRLWPQAHKYFEKKRQSDLINDIFFNSIATKRGVMPTSEPEGEQ